MRPAVGVGSPATGSGIGGGYCGCGSHSSIGRLAGRPEVHRCFIARGPWVVACLSDLAARGRSGLSVVISLRGWRLRPSPANGAAERRRRPRSRRCAMTALLIGYARVSTDAQDLTAQREGLLTLGVERGRLYVAHGLPGPTREPPGLREALAACREGDTLVVTKLDRLAGSLPDARAIADELTARQVRLSLGGSVYDPNDAVGRLLFNVLAMVAEFESDLIRLRTKEGMRAPKAKGRLRGK